MKQVSGTLSLETWVLVNRMISGPYTKSESRRVSARPYFRGAEQLPSTPEDLTQVRLPADTAVFQFFFVVATQVPIAGSMVRLESSQLRQGHSGLFFINGRLVQAEDIEKLAAQEHAGDPSSSTRKFMFERFAEQMRAQGQSWAVLAPNNAPLRCVQGRDQIITPLDVTLVKPDDETDEDRANTASSFSTDFLREFFYPAPVAAS